MAFSNSLLDRWKSGAVTYGLWCMTANPTVAEYVSTTDVDWVLWDQQHGLVTDADLAPAFRSCIGRGLAPVVRVAANDMTLIGRALDAGAYGVVIPLVDTAADAAKAAAAP